MGLIWGEEEITTQMEALTHELPVLFWVRMLKLMQQLFYAFYAFPHCFFRMSSLSLWLPSSFLCISYNTAFRRLALTGKGGCNGDT